jgi:hypothetical protein
MDPGCSTNNNKSPSPEPYSIESIDQSLASRRPKKISREKCKQLLLLTNNYCESHSKTMLSLKLSDFMDISIQLGLTPEKCFQKIKDILITDKVNCTEWTEGEEALLYALVDQKPKWKTIAGIINSEIHNGAPIRNARQCKYKWKSKLDPNLTLTEPWSLLEEIVLLERYEEFGGNWKQIGIALNGARNKSNIKGKLEKLKKEAIQSFNCSDDINAGLRMLLKKKKEIYG